MLAAGDHPVATITTRGSRALSELERENVLLRKQAELIKLQVREVREEVRSIEARAGRAAPSTSRETFTLSEFVPRKDGSPSTLLQEAIKFYETHDGCPLFEQGCTREDPGCNGVWVRMGHPCWQLVAHVKTIAGALTPRGDA